MAGRKKNRRATLCLVISPAENSSAIDNYRTRERETSSSCCLLDQRSLTIFSSSCLLFQPNEAGFVLLGDLTLDSSTDPDDGYQMVRCSRRIRRLGTPNRLFSCFQGPPSPCDVEFENAYIVPEGKSSIRTRPKEVKVSSLFTQPRTVWEIAQLSTCLPALVK